MNGRWIIFIVYCTVAIVASAHHEFWLDEAHHFLLARDSNSLTDLYRNARYEGHPLLWNFLLWIGCKVWMSAVWLKIINLLFAAGTVWLLLFRSPFKLYFAALACFGYFFVYEYSVIARNYSMLVFFLFLSLHFLEQNKINGFFISILFMFLSHFFGLLFAFGILLYVSVSAEARQQFLQKKNVFISSCLILLGILLAYLNIAPPDHFLHKYNQVPLFSLKNLERVFSTPFKAFFPVPDITSAHPWNKHLLVENSKMLGAALSVISFFIPAIILWKNRKLVLIYYAMATPFFLFIAVSPLIVATRHCGFLFLALVCCLWIGKVRPEKNIGGVLTFSILILQFFCGSFFYCD